MTQNTTRIVKCIKCGHLSTVKVEDKKVPYNVCYWPSHRMKTKPKEAPTE
jgi:Zn ribbon nucleic-acid-binding protein